MASEDTKTETNTSTTVPINPDVNASASKIAQGISKAYDAGPQVFNESTFSPAGTTTQDAWGKALKAGNDMIGSGGFTPAQQGIDKQYQELYGAYDQNAPGYDTLRTNAMNDAVKNVGAGFVNSGRFGGGSYIDTATKSAVDAIAPLDYANYQNGVNNKLGILSTRNGLQQQGLSNVNNAVAGVGAVGAAMDSNSQGILNGRFDLQQRQANGWTDLISKLASAQAGNAAGAGSTTTSSQTSPQTPWWMSLASLGAQAL